MTTVERLLDLAAAYANAAAWADRERVAARSATEEPEKAKANAKVERADAIVDANRAALRADLQHALEMPVYAVPDTKLPVCTWQKGEVLIRGLTATGDRGVRVRYTPEQALTTGVRLIACAAVTDERLGGKLSGILGTFLAAEASAPTATGPDTPDAGRRA